jgi:hypothetical protein
MLALKHTKICVIEQWAGNWYGVAWICQPRTRVILEIEAEVYVLTPEYPSS